MSISASTYKKILSIKTWATNKLPTVSEENYTTLLTDLLKYLDDLITNNDFFETDIKKLVDEINKLLAMEFPSQENIDKAIANAKSEITTAYTSAINSAKSSLTEEYTQAIENSAQTLTTNITNVNNELTKTKKSLETNISTVSGKVDTTMNNHKKSIKDTITGAMENITREG